MLTDRAHTYVGIDDSELTQIKVMTTITGTDIAADHSVADIDDVINLSADKDGSIDHSELIRMILVISELIQMILLTSLS